MAGRRRDGGALIARARRRAGISQDELARRLGTTGSAISRWERGGVDPAYGNVERAVEACGLDLVTLLTEPEADPHGIERTGSDRDLGVPGADRRDQSDRPWSDRP